MSNYRNTNDLKKAVLTKCGELTDGTSDFDANALTYLNNLHRSILSGGMEFETELSEPWSWAISKRPIVLTLMPSILVTATMTENSTALSFSAAPTDTFGVAISVAGWHLKLDQRDEYFVIQSHTASGTAATIEVPYTEASGALSATLYKFDYDLIDDSVIVSSQNNKVDFSRGVTTYAATLTAGTYSPSAYATHVAARMGVADSGQAYVGSWDSVQRLFKLSAAAAFALLNATGTNVPVNAAADLGLDALDYTAATSFTSAYPLNGINRLTAPMQLFRKNTNDFLAASDQGKVYEIDVNTFIRRHPLVQVRQGMPDRFAVLSLSSTGIARVRFNTYVDQATKVEVGYIGLKQDLQDNSASIPLLPHAFREALVFGASYYVMLDKSDDRAPSFAQLCKAKLDALVHHNRKELGLAGNNYGKLVPRAGQARRSFVTEIT